MATALGKTGLACGAACDLCSVRTSVLFAGIEPQLLGRIQHAIEERRLARGTSLYRLAEAGRAIYTVRDGLVKLLQYLPDGSERIVRLVRPTDVTGLEALLGQPYQHDAVVEQDATVCRIPVEVVRMLEEESPQLYRELMRRWQQALSEADAWFTELSTGTARQRVARLLLRLVDEQGNSVCQLFGRRDIAAMLGITTETASRLVAEFKREGYIVQTGNGFRCPLGPLRDIAAD